MDTGAVLALVEACGDLNNFAKQGPHYSRKMATFMVNSEDFETLRGKTVLIIGVQTGDRVVCS
jgi:hypothetical protein